MVKKRRCKAICCNGKQCSVSASIGDYCLQHFKERKFNDRGRKKKWKN